VGSLKHILVLEYTERGTSVDALFFLEAQDRTTEACIYDLYLRKDADVAFLFYKINLSQP
jgi:hypothetical protein